MEKQRYRGALLIEYALIFAFILIVGVFFVNDQGMSNPINSIFNTTSTVLDKANTKDNKITFSGLTDYFCWSSDSSKFETGSTWDGGFATNQRVLLGPGTYEITFDVDKFASLMNDKQDYSKMNFCLMGYKFENGKNTDIVLDSFSPENTTAYHQTYVTTKAYVVGENGLRSYTFENKGEAINFGVNFQKNGVSLNGKDQAVLDKAMQESLTITKK